MPSPFVQRVVLRNYKSIAACDVRLARLTFLVGPNGSGKSNFLDALRLVSDGLVSPLDHALRERGGIDDVRRRSTGHPHNFGVRLELQLPQSKRRALYAFEVAAKKNGAFELKEEKCSIEPSPPLLAPDASDHSEASYLVRRGTVEHTTLDRPPKASPDRLFLVSLSGIQPFRELFDALTSMAFYNLAPGQIREPHPPDPGKLLARDGRNIAGVLRRLRTEAPESVARIRAYLEQIVPGVRDVTGEGVANKEVVVFRQDVKGAERPWKFYANSMSDGTLRALGVLVAVTQAMDTSRPVSLVGIEEPEAAVHPAAASVLYDALDDASHHTQIVVTSHSPDLLDSPALTDEQLLAVVSEEGVTSLGPISDVGRSTMRDNLYTAGELLRMSQLEPVDTSRALDADQLDLFAPLSP